VMTIELPLIPPQNQHGTLINVHTVLK